MWNESARIEATVATLADAFGDRAVEVIFVDDGSDDGTADVVERACKEAALDAEVMRLTENRGKGAAVRAGLLGATGDTVGFVDADLSAGPAEIERVFAAVDDGRGDVVLASRATADATITVRQPFAAALERVVVQPRPAGQRSHPSARHAVRAEGVPRRRGAVAVRAARRRRLRLRRRGAGPRRAPRSRRRPRCRSSGTTSTAAASVRCATAWRRCGRRGACGGPSARRRRRAPSRRR